MTEPDRADCARCGYPVVKVEGRWVHDQQGDAAMCQILDFAERGRKAQAAVDALLGPHGGRPSDV